MNERDNWKVKEKQEKFYMKKITYILATDENIKDVSRRLIERNRQVYEQLAKH